jgi:hypothetical protein
LLFVATTSDKLLFQGIIKFFCFTQCCELTDELDELTEELIGSSLVNIVKYGLAKFVSKLPLESLEK